jgi:nucleoside-diphosphate-sugar epimerase
LKPIVITGARGYIGAALARRLAGEGRALRLVSRPSSGSAAAPVGGAAIETIEADLCDETVWARLLRDAATVVHLSARTDLRAAEADPAGDEALNVEPVRALVRAAANLGTRPNVVFASTVTIVGPQHAIPADERTLDRPCSVYDRHKLACETILREATIAGTLAACTLRLSNVYGPAGTSVNSNRGILNVMMRRALSGEPLTIYGDGAYTRDFTHLDDVVDAFAMALDAGSEVRDGSHYVIATGQGHTLVEAYRLIVQAAFAATGRRVEVRHVAEPADLHPIERRNFIGNSSLYQGRTGWRPRISLPEGIGRFFTAESSRLSRAMNVV